MTFCGFWDCLRKCLAFSRPTYGLPRGWLYYSCGLIWRSSHYARFCHVIKYRGRSASARELFTLLIAAILPTGAPLRFSRVVYCLAWFYLSEAKYARYDARCSNHYCNVQRVGPRWQKRITLPLSHMIYVATGTFFFQTNFN